MRPPPVWPCRLRCMPRGARPAVTLQLTGPAQPVVAKKAAPLSPTWMLGVEVGGVIRQPPFAAGAGETTGFGATGVHPDSVGTAIGVEPSRTTTVQSSDTKPLALSEKLPWTSGRTPAELPNDSAMMNDPGAAPVPVILSLPCESDAWVTVNARPCAGMTNSAAIAASMMYRRTQFPPERPVTRGQLMDEVFRPDRSCSIERWSYFPGGGRAESSCYSGPVLPGTPRRSYDHRPL